MRNAFATNDALSKIEALAAAAGYLVLETERSLQLELIERIEIIAREAAMPEGDAEHA